MLRRAQLERQVNLRGAVPQAMRVISLSAKLPTMCRAPSGSAAASQVKMLNRLGYAQELRLGAYSEVEYWLRVLDARMPCLLLSRTMDQMDTTPHGRKRQTCIPLHGEWCSLKRWRRSTDLKCAAAICRSTDGRIGGAFASSTASLRLTRAGREQTTGLSRPRCRRRLRRRTCWILRLLPRWMKRRGNP